MRSIATRRRGSLLGRIVGANLMVAVLSVVSITFLSLLGYRADFVQQQSLRAQTLARFLARQSEVPVLVGDRGGLEKIAASALSAEDVLGIRIVYRGNTPQQVQASRDMSGERTPSLRFLGNEWVEASEEIRPEQSGLLDWDASATRQPESLGQVWLRISLKKEEALFRRTAVQAIEVMSALLLLIPAVGFFRVRNLLRPLGELVAFTQRVGRGDLLSRSRVDQAEEIADVAIAFNRMLDRLGQSTVSRDYVDNIIRSMSESLIVVAVDGTIKMANEATLRMLGYEENQLIGEQFSSIAGNEGGGATVIVTAAERFWLRRDGRRVPVLCSSATLRKSLSGEEGVVWIAQDISEQKRVREELIAARERYALAVAGANDGIWDWNLLNGKVYFSPRWKGMLGYGEDDVSGRLEAWFGLLHPDDRRRVEHEMDQHRVGISAMFESEHRMRHRDGTYHWMLSRGLAVRGPDGQATRIAGSQTDITNNKVSDPLTGLPNRVRFTEKLGAAFARRRQDPDYRCAVLFLDLDRFKMINDSLGHLAGDQLLKGIAQRLSNRVKAEYAEGEYTVARLSGDEFAVLIENISESDAGAAGAALGASLLRDLTVPFTLAGREVFTSFSIGVAPDTGDYNNPAEILRDADTAMYRAKSAGKSRCEVFDSEMRAQAVARLELDTDLRKALENDQFLVYYQPTFSIPGERLAGFEALARWSHPKRGLVPPNDFISQLEETGLIVPMGEFILRESCRQLRQWQLRYPDFALMTISVNLSPRQFLVPDLPRTVSRILDETQLDPGCLALEITESVLMLDTERAIGTLNALKTLGVGLRIDDFGTGYSSLNYLQHFPFDTVKIDRSFLANTDNDGGTAIVRAIVSLAQNLSMNVIAEGVETSRQMKLLTHLGCRVGQGYYYSRPVPANIAEVMIASSSEPTSQNLSALAGTLARADEPSMAGVGTKSILKVR